MPSPGRRLSVAGFYRNKPRGYRSNPYCMKSQTLIVSSLLALGAAVSLPAQDEVRFNQAGTPAAEAPGEPAQPAEAAPQFTEAQLLETFGWFLGRRAGLPELEFSDEQLGEIVKGLRVAATGADAPYDLQAIGPAMERFMSQKQSEFMSKLRQAGLAESQKFLSEIRQKAGVVSTDTGLAYEIVQQGTGEKPKPTDTVKVHYTGTLVNGTVFDSSVQNGEPAEFQLNRVIPGWTEGLQHLQAGGKMKLYVPPQLAYGDQGAGQIPPSSTLIFDVELLEVKPTPAEPAAGAAPTPPPAK